MQKKVNVKEQNQLLFQDKLPAEILKELTPEIRRQYFLWDEIIKREVQLHPRLLSFAWTIMTEYQIMSSAPFGFRTAPPTATGCL